MKFIVGWTHDARKTDGKARDYIQIDVTMLILHNLNNLTRPTTCQCKFAMLRPIHCAITIVTVKQSHTRGAAATKGVVTNMIVGTPTELCAQPHAPQLMAIAIRSALLWSNWFPDVTNESWTVMVWHRWHQGYQCDRQIDQKSKIIRYCAKIMSDHVPQIWIITLDIWKMVVEISYRAPSKFLLIVWGSPRAPSKLCLSHLVTSRNSNIALKICISRKFFDLPTQQYLHFFTFSRGQTLGKLDRTTEVTTEGKIGNPNESQNETPTKVKTKLQTKVMNLPVANTHLPIVTDSYS